MTKSQNSTWRSLDATEIALAKGMILRDLPRDYIHSFFVRPGRVVSPAFVSELTGDGDKRPDIEPAGVHDVEAYIARRLSEAARADRHHGFGPTSELRVREILQLSREGQAALPGFESHFAEFKSELPANKLAKAKMVKTLVGYANHQGGYLFVGLTNDGSPIGLPDGADVETFWDELGDVVKDHFTPFFQWERSEVRLGGKRIAVAYSYESNEKPIIASHSYTNEITEGQIFFRYSRSTEVIRAGDLIKILHERDRKTSSRAMGEIAAPPLQA